MQTEERKKEKFMLFKEEKETKFCDNEQTKNIRKVSPKLYEMAS